MSPFRVVNNKGTIAFQAITDLGPDTLYAAIYTSIAGSVPQAPLQRVVDATGMAPDIGAVLSINDNGTVAFQGRLYRGSEPFQGIFTGPDPIADRVIVAGDSLCGSKVIGLDLSREALSDSGELTFHALLEDGSRVIVRATPVAGSGHR